MCPVFPTTGDITNNYQKCVHCSGANMLHIVLAHRNDKCIANAKGPQSCRESCFTCCNRHERAPQQICCKWIEKFTQTPYGGEHKICLRALKQQMVTSINTNDFYALHLDKLNEYYPTLFHLCNG